MFYIRLVIKIAVMLLIFLCASIPFILEYSGFLSDKENKTAYKRFRILLYTLIYTLAITVVFFLLKEVTVWFENLSLVKKIASLLSIKGRFPYAIKLFGALIVNIAIAWGFVILLPIVRIGLKKKNLVEPNRKNGKFSFFCELERKLIKKIYNPTSKLIAKVLKKFNIAVSVASIVMFTVYLIPAMWGAKWFPYGIVSNLFSASYIYPVITLLLLWEAYFFLEGICLVESQCPKLLEVKAAQTFTNKADISELKEKCKEDFGAYFIAELDSAKENFDKVSSTHSTITNIIAQGIENDGRNPQVPKENYLVAMDRVVESEKSIVFRGGFFSEFSMYFLRYLSVIIARGDNILFICNDNMQIKNVADYLTTAFSETVSVYSDGDGENYDAPIWKIVTVKGDCRDRNEGKVDNCSVLVTTLDYICSQEFENEHGEFVYHLDSVVFIDTLNTVNNYYAQMTMLNAKLKHMTEINAVDAKNVMYNRNLSIHYMSRQVRYFCFDGNDNPGMDKTLKSMLTVDFESVDSSCYCNQTVVCCCSLEGKLDKDGNRVIPQVIDAENMGVILNLALYCAMSGASGVSIFADGLVPYANYMESLNWNLGKANINLNGCISVNTPKYNPDGYDVIIAVDANDNLPAALRKYRDMVSDKPTLLIVVARNYLFRDYYAENIDRLWGSHQIERIPFIENSADDIVRKILIKANSGGISEKDLFSLASLVPDFNEDAKAGQTERILHAILRMYDIPDDDISFYNYFEYTTVNDFDKNGNFCIETRIELRREGQLFEFISGKDCVVLLDGDSRIPLCIHKNRICQNFIEGQNFLHQGNIYTVLSVDKTAGTVAAKLVASGANVEPYINVQSREYVIEYTPEKCVYEDAPQHIPYHVTENGVSVESIGISMFRVPLEVITHGYYSLNNANPSVSDDTPNRPLYYSITQEHNSKLSKNAYRKYGDVTSPSIALEDMEGVPLTSYSNGALAISLKINTDLGEAHDKVANLLSVMLSEVLRSMFPSVSDAVVICPVLHGETDPEYADILNRYPRLRVTGDAPKEGLEILIIEDCVSDLGVVSILKHDGGELFKTLFSNVYEYLDWYMNAKNKSNYLRFGRTDDLGCFDFDKVYGIARMLGRADFKNEYKNTEEFVKNIECDFCSKRFQYGTNMTKLDDGRVMCPECASHVIADKKELKSMLNRAKMYLENTYGITLDDEYEFCFETTVKIVNAVKNRSGLNRRGTDLPVKSYIDNSKKVYVEYTVPEINFMELLVRELTHVWQLKNLNDLPDDLAEGHIALVSVQYLHYLDRKNIATARRSYYESFKGVSGEGYRKLVRELAEHPEFGNNPFAYLLGTGGKGSGNGGEIQTPPKPPNPPIGTGEIGKPYKPENPDIPDRETDESATYFYYSQLSDSYKEKYNVFLDAVKNRVEEFELPGCSVEDIDKLHYAIVYDHPELFYLDYISRADGRVGLSFCATADETEMLQKRIDEAAATYLSQIDDTMSAYEVALKLHCMLIDKVDYDTAALEEEDRFGTKKGTIDRIRTLCGVFIDNRAVCAGYAHALTYLLRKCGIMCAYDAGVTNTGRHAWNIVKLDGDYYYIDATWDDRSTTTQTVKTRDIGFSYFAVTTEELYRTRKSDERIVPMPVCTATKCNYYVHNGLVVDSYNIEVLKKLASDVVSGGSKIFTFKCSSAAVFKECTSKLFDFGDGWSDIVKVASSKDKKIQSGITYTQNDDLYTITIIFKYQ